MTAVAYQWCGSSRFRPSTKNLAATSSHTQNRRPSERSSRAAPAKLCSLMWLIQALIFYFKIWRFTRIAGLQSHLSIGSNYRRKRPTELSQNVELFLR
jgi:hypothetical protein